MKYLLVGLGNMHPDYDGTRHNIGFEVGDYLSQVFEFSFKSETLGDLGSFKFKGRQVYFLKPSTYMNRSGKAVRYWKQKLKIKDDKCLVIVDDINLPLGKLRLRAKGSDGGHNGLKDITQVLQTSHFHRLRVGIGNNFSKGSQVDFVLGRWTEEEITQLNDILERITEMVKSYVSIGASRTMNQFND